MFKRVLIANRGEIAVRVIRACQELGIETAAIYSDADKNALHVQMADVSCRVGKEDAMDSYLNKEAILYAAYTAEVDAIHPGYGFLSEDADFAEMVTKGGFTWIGPMPETIRLVGDKDAARASIAPSGIPMSKGSPPLTDNEMAIEWAREVLYPVILKPVSGGGGKGMLIAHNEDELKKVLQIVDLKKIRYYFEHYIERSRHIEVQIVADNFGEVVHLGERECSIQRRNQKLLEESPSVALTDEMRERVGKLAVKAAKSVHYSNIGTVEFLLDLATNEFYFMEINPRVQVEHGVTEAVTHVDLVRTQIKIAAGEPLEFTQKDVKFYGHALECRINAEDPDNHFLPAPGKITYMHEPGGPRVRCDSGVTAGLSIEPYYDSLIAKVIAHGLSRGDSIRIMERALNEFMIEGEGIKTTISLHQRILEDPYFRTGNIDTQFIKKRLPIYEATQRKLTLKEKMHLTEVLGENLTKAIDEGLDYT